MAQRVLYGPDSRPLPEGIGRAVAMAASLTSSGDVGYRAASTTSQDMAGWNPASLSADAGWLWSRDTAVARTYDLLQNEPWAQGGVDKKVDMIIGATWRPSIKPDAEALGISPEEASALGRVYERVWRGWATDPLCRCDLEETLNAPFLFNMATMQHEVAGDGLGVVRWKEDRGWAYRTALQVIDADRLSNPMGRMDSDVLRGGIEKDLDGRPVAYHFRDAHPGDLLMGGSARAYRWERVERRETWGRPRVLHLYSKDRPGQSRGVSKLVASLARFKGLSRFSEAELTNAVMNAMFAATITSGFDPAVAEQHMTVGATQSYHELRGAFYETMKPTLSGVRLQHLFPGDELKFLTTGREAAGFSTFTLTFLRSIASGLGISYEQLSGDWSQVNYSSARAALVEVWRGILKARARVEMMMATPLLLAVLEDAIDAGLAQLPSAVANLYDAPASWLRINWIGPARGWVDPVKEAQAALMRIEAGLSNYELECAEQGIDFEENLAALMRQKGMWADAKLTPPALAAMLAVQPRSDDPEPSAVAA